MLSRLDRRRTVWLAGVRPLLVGNTSDWLVALRWIALVGMLITSCVARVLVPDLALLPVFSVLGVLAVLNAFWSWRGVRWVSPQLILDLAVLGTVLWFTGGLQNPFAVFLTFQVALAAFAVGGGDSVRMAVLAVGVAAVLTQAPPLPWHSARLPHAQVQQLGEFAALVGVVVFVGLYAYVLHQRIETLQAESGRNERFAVLGRLMAGMAHEINTPLATIVVASDELVAAGRELGSEEVERLSLTISQEAKRASNVIKLLRGQTKIGYLSERISVAAMVREVVPRELVNLGFRGTFELSIPEGTMEAWASPTAVRQILGNLLKNAVEAMPAGVAGTIRVTVTEREGRILIAVEDDGRGIRPEDLPHLGEPFRTTKQDEGGTGLGLYVSSLLAEQMGAMLRIDSGVQCSTRATLSLRTSRLAHEEDHASLTNEMTPSASRTRAVRE